MDYEQLKSNIGRALNSFLFTILYELKSLDGTKYTHVWPKNQILQGNTYEELPEELLGTCRLNHLDASKSVRLKLWFWPRNSHTSLQHRLCSLTQITEQRWSQERLAMFLKSTCVLPFFPFYTLGAI